MSQLPLGCDNKNKTRKNAMLEVCIAWKRSPQSKII